MKKKEVKSTNKKIITVCTPTYNRKHTLDRPFKSLLNQTNKNFIWLIIDDGSIDGTEEIVKEFIKVADFQIEYHRKENGGRHTALNYSYKYIKTELVINLDSDDELVNDAIEKIEKIYNSIPDEEKNRFWQISGRCIDNINRNMVGKLYPDDINNLRGKKQRKKMYKINGEKSNCRRVEILRNNLFPVYDDTKFVTENTVWEKINREYDTYCTNEIFRVYYVDSTDSLAKGKTHSNTRMLSRYHYSIFCLNVLFDEILYNKNVIISIINLGRSSICSKIKYKKVMNDLNKFYVRVIATVIGYPLGFIYSVLNHEISFKRNNKNEK